MENNKDKVYFGQANFRGQRTNFGIKKGDRTKHMYVIGKTGMGKTTLLENMAIQDIRNGAGLAIIDPHGSFAEKMLEYIPEERINDVVYFNPADYNCPIAFNIMESISFDQRHLVASGLMGVFKKMWPDVWSARMEYILNYSILALLEYPNATLLGVNRLLSDKEYRKEVVANVTDPVVKAFWEQEFAGYTDRFASEATPAIQNKVGQFTSNPLIRNIIGQPKSSFDFRKVMDEKKIVIINLSKGRIGEQNSNLLGAMVITKIYLAAMSRAADYGKEFSDFYLYVDEFQNFVTESFKDILSEARKYGLALIIAHQYIAQMPEEVQDAVFGNVGTHVIFRVGPSDAEVLETEFAPEFTQENIVNLGFASVYLKLSIDGVPSRPFSAVTLPPLEKPAISNKDKIIGASRKNFCGAKEDIEKNIQDWHQPLNKKDAGSLEKDSSGGEKIVPPKLYEAACSVCGKKTVIPFEPDGKRPIFCQKHRSHLNTEAKEKEVAPVKEKFSTPEHIEDKPVDKVDGIEKTVSLRELNNKTTAFRRDLPKRREKSSPDFKGLRELLSEAGVLGNESKKNDGENGKEKKINPGQSIRF